MRRKSLSPSAYLDLKIQLDKLNALQTQCVEALGGLVAGRTTPDDYMGLVDRQAKAQRAWESLHRKYFEERREA
jgi:hypothetical protein